jgi:site-specific DNA-cytosine methylase
MAGLGPVRWQCEIDSFCRRVLAKHWPSVERHEDVRSVGRGTLENVELICGGFPCQDVSSAGRQAGLSGERSGLWYEYLRIVGELRPRYVVVENVASGQKLWLPEVRRGLEALGYRTRAFSLSAFDVGAPHLRRRVFVVATDPDSLVLREQQRRRGGEEGADTPLSISLCSPRTAESHGHADVDSEPTGPEHDQAPWLRGVASGASHWASSCGVCGIYDGFSNWLHAGGLSGRIPEAGSDEVLCSLQRSLEAKALQRNAGIHGHVHPEALLLQTVRRITCCRREGHPTLESQEVAQASLRGLRGDESPTRASHKQRRVRQPAGEHSNPMYSLSPLLAPIAHAAWEEYVSSDAKTRSARLKALGNAVVPQCAEVIGRIILEMSQ